MTSAMVAPFVVAELALDRFGPRRVVVQLRLAMGGALPCYVAAGLAEMALGRVLMGAGLAGSFMAGSRRPRCGSPPGARPW